MQTDSGLNISSFALAELAELKLVLEKELSTGNSFISKEALRVLKSGGKRLRPLLTILFAMSGDPYDAQLTRYTAAAIETMHMATLVHDDTIDNSEQRRGVDTTFKKHGIHTAVYTGDWMLLKSLKLFSKVKNAPSGSIPDGLLDLLMDGLESVCNGEIDQYYGRGKIPTTEVYLQRIKGKTAALFSAACAAGAKIAGWSDSEVVNACEFGENFGIAFQIHDDMIDIISTGAKAGKPVENDLREGIITMPLLLVCNKSRSFRMTLQSFLADPTHLSASQIIKEAITLGATDLANAECDTYINKCYTLLDTLPHNRAVDDLRRLVQVVFSEYKNVNQ